MKNPTQQEYVALFDRIANGVLEGREHEAVVDVAERMFEVTAKGTANAPVFATERKLAKALVEIAAGVTGSANAVCETVLENPDPTTRTTPRTLWRYFLPCSVTDFMRAWRLVWYLFFQIARRKFGLGRKGYEIYIDETQALFFGDAPAFGEEAEAAAMAPGVYTEVALLSGASKDDAYSGRFRAFTFQVMMACLLPSRILIPIDVVLVATTGPDLPEEIRVPDRGKGSIMRHFIGLLEALYPPPRMIQFDRGYESNETYATLYRYCRRHGVIYLAPAIKVAKEIRAEDDQQYAGMVDFIRKNFEGAPRIAPDSAIRYRVAKAPIRLEFLGQGKWRIVPRTLIVFYRPRLNRPLPEGAVELGNDYWAFAFYTNHPRPQKRITWWERVYSHRWREEHGFAQKARFHDGFGHLATRRLAVYLTGFAIFSIFMLRRGVVFPNYDRKAISRHFSLPKFQRRLLKNLPTA